MAQVLHSFKQKMNIVIIGASGGLGQAFVNQLIENHKVNHIYAYARSPVNFDSQKVSVHPLSLDCEKSIVSAAQSLTEPLDLVIVASGLLHSQDLAPEKSLKDIQLDALSTVFTANIFGPALVAKHFIPLLQKKEKSVFACLSARVGSISDNRLGGWYAYRASKAALNMILKCAAIETQRKNPKACVVGLHPGTVKTALSAPFRGQVKPHQLFTPEYASQCLLKVIDEISPEHSGKVFAWDGQEIPA